MRAAAPGGPGGRASEYHARSSRMSDKLPVLVVLDDAELREFVLRALRVSGYNPDGVDSGEAGLRLLEEKKVAVMVADVFLKGLNGVELLKRARERAPTTQVILVGRDVPTSTVVSAMKFGAFDVVEKPIDVDYLLLVLEKAVRHHRLTQENQALKLLQARRPGEMVAESPSMLQVLKTLELVAPTDLTVLIEGESGVGKELVANRIHQLSPRKERPFVAVNCGAIQETLLESELFGHERGAFTGATKEHQGLFSVADGGTLFLDEIGEMNLDLQVKLLRVLERSEFRRVGGNKLIHVDVRVVAATNKKLQEEVQAGKFREDLYYRLNVIHVEVPPLRERTEDIPALVLSFLESHQRKGLPRRTVSPEAMAQLRTYDWPGNVRELRNVIERCMILCRGDTILPSDLPAVLGRSPTPPGAPAATAGRAAPAGSDEDLETPLAEIERRHILRVLDHHGGNKVRSAKALGINVKTLYNKIKAYEAEGSLPAEQGG